MAKRTGSGIDRAGTPAWLDAKMREQEARFQAFVEAEMSRAARKVAVAFAISIVICGIIASVT